MSAAADIRGLKRVCVKCGMRFYDMNKRPIVCPSCKNKFNLEEKAHDKDTVTEDAVKKDAEATPAAANDDDDIIDDDMDFVSLDDEDSSLLDVDDEDEHLDLDDDLTEMGDLGKDLSDLDDEPEEELEE